MIELKQGDCLELLKTLPDNSIDLIFCDPPYALGSEVIIKPNGKPDYKKAVDFMNKWDQPDGAFWEEWFGEAKRVLKHGGHCLMFGMDRQLWFNCYYANLSGFTQKQSLYWYFISNFPKASDLSKNLAKNLGENVTEFGGIITAGNDGRKAKLRSGSEMVYKKQEFITPLAKKYEGIKYSVAPLKQTNETIMVFQKPYKTGSCLHDVLAMEAGDNTLTCGGVDIEGNRVACDLKKEDLSRGRLSNNDTTYFSKKNSNIVNFPSSNGRFPAQTYIDSEASEIIDLQSGVGAKGAAAAKSNGNLSAFNGSNKHLTGERIEYNSGGASRILHKCDFETRTIQAKIIYKESGFYEIKIDPKYKYLLNSNGVIFDGETFGLDLSHFPEVKSYKFYHENIQTEMIDELLMPVAGSSTDLIIDLKGEICDFEAGDYDLYHYCPKVSKSERNEGLEGFEEKEAKEFIQSGIDGRGNAYTTTPNTNNHPTVKPKALLSKILKLFKVPNNQVLLDPFMGSGSMGISAVETSFDYIGYELDTEYFKIAEARIENAQSKADKRLL
jgi:DNA modification methylase